MHAFYAEDFDRELACSERQWLDLLPQAMGPCPYQLVAQALTATIDAGQLHLSWRVGEPQGGPVAEISRLRVSFRFTGLDELHRYRFMKRFDLYTQRGGR